MSRARGLPAPTSGPLLDSCARRLTARVVSLEGQLDAGEDVWREYAETVRALAAALEHVAPGRRGELLTTAQMAERLGLKPKTLLKHVAAEAIRPALRRGKLIRWKGSETIR